MNKNSKKVIDPRIDSSIISAYPGWIRIAQEYIHTYHLHSSLSRGRPQKLSFLQECEVFLLSYRERLTLRCIARLYHISKTLTATTIHKVEDFLLQTYPHLVTEISEILCPPHSPAHTTEIIMDGTHICLTKHMYHPELYSGKHHTSGYNIQVIGNTDGNPLYLSEPFPGSYHDKKCYDLLKVNDYIDPGRVLADKGYQGTGMLTPVKGKNLTYEEKQFNHNLQVQRSIIERIISRIKNWKIIQHRYRKPENTLTRTLNIITILDKKKRNTKETLFLAQNLLLR